MKSILRTSIVFIALLVIVPLSATAQQYKIDKPIFGFYLGESKQSLLQRAKQAGITCDEWGRMHGQLFPDGYFCKSSLNKSKLVSHVWMSFYKDYVGQIDVFLEDRSQEQFLRVVQVLEESWKATSVCNVGDYDETCSIVLPEVSITITRNNTYLFIEYVHLGLLNIANQEEKQTLAKDQF